METPKLVVDEDALRDVLEVGVDENYFAAVGVDEEALANASRGVATYLATHGEDMLDALTEKFGGNVMAAVRKLPESMMATAFMYGYAIGFRQGRETLADA
jgi:hypothetical protein